MPIEFTLRDIARHMWRGRYLILAASALLVATAIIIMPFMPKLYRAQLMVAPAEERLTMERNGGLLGGGGAMLGLVADQRLTPFKLYLKEFETADLADRLNNEHDLIHKIFAARWDDHENKWRPAPGPVAAINRFLAKLLGLPIATAPTVNDLRDYLRARVQVDPRSGVGVNIMTFDNVDPRFAVDMLTWMHQTSEEMVRERDVKRTRNNVAYLIKQLDAVTVEDHRNAVIGLLSKEERDLMLLSNTNAYAAQVLEGPVVSDAPVEPRPLMLLLIAGVGGAVAGWIIVLVRMLAS